MSGRKTSRGRGLICGAAGALLLTGTARTAWAATTFVPSIGIDGSWTNNIDLAPPGEPRDSGELWDAEPGFSLTHDSSREHAVLDYTMHALYFSEGGHEILHTGSLLSTTQVMPDWFELDLSGQRTQGPVSAAVPYNLQYLFPVANLADFTTGLVKPLLKHTFGEVKVEASYTQGISDSSSIAGQLSQQYKSSERDADFTATSADRNQRLTWTVDYQRQRQDYQSPYDEEYLYEESRAELRLLVGSSLRLIARGGVESNPETGIGEGGLGSPLWAAGFDWSTGPRDDLSLLAGHRFYGSTYEALWRRQTRLLNLQVTYSEEPTSQEAQMMQGSLAGTPAVVVPGTPIVTQLTPDVFLDKSLNAAATLTGRLTSIGVSINSDERSYFTNGAVIPAAVALADDYRERSATLYASRRLGPLMSAALTATVGRVGLGEAQGTYDTYQYTASLTRMLGRRTSAYLRASQVQQFGTIAEYRATIVSLGFNMAFAGPPQSPGLQLGAPGAPAPANDGP